MAELAGDAYYINVPSITAYMNVLNKWENKPNYTYEQLESYKQALGFLDSQYGYMFEKCEATSEEIYGKMDMTKSPGYYGTHFGLRTKGECIADRGYQKFLEEFNFTQPDIWNAVIKKEYLPKDSLDVGKNRVFVIPGVNLTYFQLKYGMHISERIKMAKWSAYGFNPYNGGCDRLGKLIASKPIRVCSDYSKFDVNFILLPAIHKAVRARNPHWTHDQFMEFEWMTSNTAEPLIKIFNGLVYKKRWGNPSGSGKTTLDNILGHIIMMATLLIAAYAEDYGVPPPTELLAAQIVRIYGDDGCHGLDECFRRVLDKSFVESILGAFGVQLKYWKGGYEYPLEELEFLGFNFFELDVGFSSFYLPRYDEKKLATSMVYDGVDHLSREAFISRTFILYMMSFTNERHRLFASCAKNLAREYSKFHDLTPAEIRYVDLINKTDEQLLFSVFTGNESCGGSGEVFNIFSSATLLEEAGIKEIFFPQLGHEQPNTPTTTATNKDPANTRADFSVRDEFPDWSV